MRVAPRIRIGLTVQVACIRAAIFVQGASVIPYVNLGASAGTLHEGVAARKTAGPLVAVP